MSWLLVLAIASGVAAIVVTLAAVHYTLQAQRQYERLLEQVPKAAHLADLEQRIKDRRTDVEKLSGQVAEHERLKQALPGLEAAIADLERKKSALLPIEAEYVGLGAQLENRKREHSELNGKIERAQSQLGEVEASVARLKDTRNEVTAAVAGLEVTRSGLEKTVADLLARESAAMKSANEAKAELARLSTEVTNTEKRLSQLKIELSKSEAEMAPLREAKASLVQEVKRLETEAQRRTERSEDLQQKIAALLVQKAQLEEAIKQLEQRRKELADETERMLKGFIEQGRVMTGGFDFVDAFEAVSDPALPEKSRMRDALEEARALEEIAQHAKALGFVYSDRVIRSFHTSLKLGGQSPLLVLAGISGTGKSQLPRLYCDALGINFLSMAVQPGWDSPADLLGFFSHIERRFKPTPLARALLQMDPYALEALKKLDGKDSSKGKAFREKIVAHHDELLMVLLDEMNLARIEYYFSEFLSKLEIRNGRGFDDSDPTSRARAEVLLEAPNAKGGLQALPLFAGKNVFFVGTMNEDESTMALSDKVIDRANVLRFGRPAKLEAVQPKSGKAARADRLSSQVWKRWCESTVSSAGREAEIRRMRAWIEALNEGMDRAHRPFAYRTDQAIQAYCLGYPRAGLDPDAALRMAFSDQIEQRIMPKLRGLDHQEPGGRDALAAVLRVVEELKDTDLEAAIELGMQANGGSSFAWYGVTRSDKTEPIRR